MVIIDKWTDLQLSVVYSPHEYCNHSSYLAEKEFSEIFRMHTDEEIFRMSISRNTIRKIWQEEDWGVDDILNRGRSIEEKDKELSVICNLHEYCNRDTQKAREEFEAIFNKKIFPVAIRKVWEAWGLEEKVSRKETLKPQGECFDVFTPSTELTISQKEKLDRLFEMTGGNPKIASSKTINISPGRVLDYWKSQGYV